ncbi:hypothetical protein QE357_001033 [Siphonobacter sp. BAB-5404]|nr:hypothetical protein [Siphonobacter sp. SORGH_AS_0500]
MYYDYEVYDSIVEYLAVYTLVLDPLFEPTHRIHVKVILSFGEH